MGMAIALCLEPGVSVTHDAVRLCAETATLLLWIGEAGVRVYSAGMPGGSSGERLIEQALIHADSTRRLAAAGRLYELMFGTRLPPSNSIEKLRGIEGSRVRALYVKLASERGLSWSGRENSPKDMQEALGFATSCLYGIAEAVILAAGYSPAIGIVHSGDSRSLVFDLADTIKFQTVVPLAFDVCKEGIEDVRNTVRRRCRDLFREENVASTLFDNLATIFSETE